MIYDEASGRILLGVKELVSTVKLGISLYCIEGRTEPSISFKHYLDFESEGIKFRLLSGDCDIDASSVNYTYPVNSTLASPTAYERSYARAEGFVLCSVARGEFDLSDNAPTQLKISYVSKISGAVKEEKEEISSERLSEFFKKCADAIPRAARAEIERLTLRAPSMRAVKFPYSTVRDGQRDFIKAAHRIMSRGGELMATAPTGTGKTVSALFPAVRAIGEGCQDKVFYLTPKTTTAAAAAEAIEKMEEGGAHIRALVLTAKEKLCKKGVICSDGKELCDGQNEGRIYSAAMELFDRNITVVTSKEISETAERAAVCPYELSLTYSELCDVIICDFNYLFDPKVYLRRYFSREGAYALLIDEAHNLPERAREMYSAEISYGQLLSLALSDVTDEHSEEAAVAKSIAEKFKELLFPYVKDEIRESADGNKRGAYHSKSVPDGLIELLGKASTLFDRLFLRALGAKDENRRPRIRAIRDYLYRINSFIRIHNFFDEGFEFFLFSNDDELKAKLFCLDTGRVIREKTALASGTVFFSATLAPSDYYKGVLGVGSSASLLNVDSPFAKEQLAVAIIESINTRFSARDESLISVCRAIAATLSAKRGHYIVFAPSYEYCDKLHKAFEAKYPKIRSICQKSKMSENEKVQFLNEFSTDPDKYLVAFCVMGGIYSEGIDLVGDKLIGAIVVGIGMPVPTFEREAIAAYYDDLCESGKLYSYVYPGMNKVLQAAGRVIRSEDDRGTILLIDDRFRDPVYKKSSPALWGKLNFFDNPKALKEFFESFWQE